MADEVGPLQPGLPPRTVGERRRSPQGERKRKSPRPPPEDVPPEEDVQKPKPPRSGGIIDEYV